MQQSNKERIPTGAILTMSGVIYARECNQVGPLQSTAETLLQSHMDITGQYLYMIYRLRCLLQGLQPAIQTSI